MDRKSDTFQRATLEEVNFSSGKGYINATFQKLLDTFGVPNYLCHRNYMCQCRDGKVRVQWAFKLSEGRIVTIYDWKDPAPIEEVTRWAIGGKGSGLELFGWVFKELDIDIDEHAESLVD